MLEKQNVFVICYYPVIVYYPDTYRKFTKFSSIVSQ